MTDTEHEPVRLFRCYPKRAGAKPGTPGHWSYLPRPQLHGRWDNADLYDSWYFSRTAVGAIAESFYNKRSWVPEVFLTPTGEPRALVEFEYTGPRPLDFDDAQTLADLGARPRQVVVQDLGVTQGIARRVYASQQRSYGGISWWSAQLPTETSVLLWGADGQPPAGLARVGSSALSLDHPAVIEAAAKLYRPLG